MRKVRREELVDYVTYGEQRDALRVEMFAIKKVRRIHLGEHLTFLFENADTTRYQVQEMMRAERIVKEADIQHELDTYNGLLGGPGELACSLLIEIEDAEDRAEKLARWGELPAHIYLRVEDGARVAARYDEAQMSPEKLSSVQYLQFPLEGRAPVALGVSAPEELASELELTPEQRSALAADLQDEPEG